METNLTNLLCINNVKSEASEEKRKYLINDHKTVAQNSRNRFTLINLLKMKVLQQYYNKASLKGHGFATICYKVKGHHSSLGFDKDECQKMKNYG